MKKLWVRASQSFQLRRSEGSGSNSFLASGRMAAVFWPDGRPCWQINAYLISLRHRRRQVSTVNTYAADLSIFVRFLNENMYVVDDVNDDRLIDFANSLLDDKVRGSRVNQVVNRVLRFLDWYQHRCASGQRLIGLNGDGARITVQISSTRRGPYQSLGFEHPAMSNRSIPRVVFPMPKVYIEKLQAAIPNQKNRSFCRARNSQIITLLMESGVRRKELTGLTVDSLNRALENGGQLLVHTAKRTDGSNRFVPIDLDTLRIIKKFVAIQREIRMNRIKKARPLFRDPGWLFCKESGSRLSDGAVTRLFSVLRRAAGITARAHPHMMRHRWITLRLASLIRSMRSIPGMPQDLLVTVLTRLMFETGHSSIAALMKYVDFASEELLSAQAGEGRIVPQSTLKVLTSLLKQIEELPSLVSQAEELPELLKEVRRHLVDALAVPAPQQRHITSKLR